MGGSGSFPVTLVYISMSRPRANTHLSTVKHLADSNNSKVEVINSDYTVYFDAILLAFKRGNDNPFLYSLLDKIKPTSLFVISYRCNLGLLHLDVRRC